MTRLIGTGAILLAAGALPRLALAAQANDDPVQALCMELHRLGAPEPLPDDCQGKILTIDAGPGLGLFPRPVPPAVVNDPPRDPHHPAANRQLLVPSHGEGMNALFLLAAGEGPHPTMLLLHGLPGNERNLDLAQAVRRAGWNVLTFTYRGAWGSPGRFSIGNAMEDTDAAVDFLRSEEAVRRYGIDPKRLVVAGHSMGGLAAALLGATDRDLAGLILLDAWNAGADGDALAAAGSAGRAEFERDFDDLGNALQGADVGTIYAEVVGRRSEWNLLRLAPRLAPVPVLTVYARHGGAEPNKAVADAIRRAPGARVEAVELDSDHAFADHRIALAAEVVRWLGTLPRAR